MKLSYLSSAALILSRVVAYLVSPDGTAAPGAIDSCSEWVEDSYALTCAIIEKTFGLTEEQFEDWNPTTTELGDECTLISGFYYCVQINYSTMSTLSTSSPTSTTAGTSTTTSSVAVTTTQATTLTTSTVSTTTSSGYGVSTPTPYQSGMTSDCDAFHLVISGDGCYDIAADAGVDLSDFYTWNPAVGTDCASLWAGYYVCIGTTESTPTTTAVATTTTTTSAGVVTPTPYQSGMVDDCDTFHDVVSGDGCYDIATDAGIALSDFYDWNPAVGDDCASLWAGNYVCIGIE